VFEGQIWEIFISILRVVSMKMDLQNHRTKYQTKIGYANNFLEFSNSMLETCKVMLKKNNVTTKSNEGIITTFLR
jgi:hypothetical protein